MPYRRVISTLVERIRTGALGCGDPIGSEAALAAEFRVSRATISKAMLLLRDYGLVVGPAGGTAVVADSPGCELALAAIDLAERAKRSNGSGHSRPGD